MRNIRNWIGFMLVVILIQTMCFEGAPISESTNTSTQSSALDETSATLGSTQGTSNTASATSNSSTISSQTSTTQPAIIPETLSIVPKTQNLEKGLTLEFTATVTYSDSHVEEVTTQVNWMSSDASIAEISNDPAARGMATALALGTTTITASFAELTDSTSLTVIAAKLINLEIQPNNATLLFNGKQQFTVEGSYSDGSTQDLTTSVTWHSSDDTIASISNASGSEGEATSLKEGTTNITASLDSLSDNGVLIVILGDSCLDILNQGLSPGDGLYWIDPDGNGGRDPIEVVCDMSADGGGWTLVASNYSGDTTFPRGTNRTDLMIDTENASYNDEPAVTSDYLIGPTISDLPFSEVRVFSDRYEDGSAVIDVKWDQSCYQCTLLDNGFTTMPGHNVVSVGCTNAIHCNLDAQYVDSLNGFNSNMNQRTIGAACTHTGADPEQGTYIGHGETEDVWYGEGNYYEPPSQACSYYDFMIYTTWVR